MGRLDLSRMIYRTVAQCQALLCNKMIVSMTGQLYEKKISGQVTLFFRNMIKLELLWESAAGILCSHLTREVELVDMI